MKKTTRQNSSKSAKPSATTRHSKKTEKPVTIELTAEKVETKSENPQQVKTSVPKSARKSTPKTDDKIKDKPAAETSQKDDSRQKFGRSGNKADKANNNEKSNSSEPAAVSPEPTSSTPAKTKSRGALVPAIVGGCIALCGAGLLQYMGFLGTPGASKADYVTGQMLTESQSELSKKIAVLESSSQNQDLDALITRKLAELKTSQPDGDGLDVISTQVNETTLRVEKLQADVANINSKLGELTSAVSNGEAGEQAGVATITARVAELSSSLETVSTEIETLKSQSKSQENQPAAESEGTTTALAGIAALQSALPGLKKDVDDQIEALNQKLSMVEQQTGELTTLKSNIDDLKTSLSVSAEATKAQQAAIATLETKIGDKASAEQRAAQAIAATALKSEIDQGLPFKESLQTLVNLVGGSDELTKLGEFSESGVPTIAKLTSEFEGVGEAIVKSLAPKPNDDLTSRLLAGAKAFVKVKTTQTLEGSSPEALVSQIFASLVAGELQKASDLFATLPQEGQDIAQDWHGKLQSRLQANSLVANTVQSFLLSGPTR